jgi:hypothetical protein
MRRHGLRKQVDKIIPNKEKYNLLELLLWAELVAVAAFSLAAVGGTRRETSLDIWSRWLTDRYPH